MYSGSLFAPKIAVKHQNYKVYLIRPNNVYGDRWRLSRVYWGLNGAQNVRAEYDVGARGEKSEVKWGVGVKMRVGSYPFVWKWKISSIHIQREEIYIHHPLIFTFKYMHVYEHIFFYVYVCMSNFLCFLNALNIINGNSTFTLLYACYFVHENV